MSESNHWNEKMVNVDNPRLLKVYYVTYTYLKCMWIIDFTSLRVKYHLKFDFLPSLYLPALYIIERHFHRFI